MAKFGMQPKYTRYYKATDSECSYIKDRFTEAGYYNANKSNHWSKGEISQFNLPCPSNIT